MIDNIVGRPVSKAGVFFGYAFLVGSPILFFTTAFVAGIFLFIVSLLMVSLFQGVQIDSINKKIRSYFSILGIKKGKWEELEKFPFICILRKDMENEVDSLGTFNSPLILKGVQYEICLLTNNHFDRMLLKTTDQMEIAKQLAEEYSGKLGKPIVEYHPKHNSPRRR